MSDTNAPDVRKIDLKELASGLPLILVAAAFAVSALRNLSLGTAAQHGAGLLSAAGHDAARADRIDRHGARVRPRQRATGKPTVADRVRQCWPRRLRSRSVKGLGFVGAIALTVLVSAWASRAMTSAHRPCSPPR
jgi:hypothetical protein